MAIAFIGENNLIINSFKEQMIQKGHQLRIIQNPLEALATLFKTKFDLIYKFNK